MKDTATYSLKSTSTRIKKVYHVYPEHAIVQKDEVMQKQISKVPTMTTNQQKSG